MPQCSAFTLQGVQCRRQAAVGQTCCAQHVGVSAAENERRQLIVPRRLQEQENWQALRAEQRQRIARLQRPRPARPAPVRDAHGLPFNHREPVHRDNQNVHRADVNTAQKPILEALVRIAEPLKNHRQAYSLYKKLFPVKNFFQHIFNSTMLWKPPSDFEEVEKIARINTGLRFGDYSVELTTVRLGIHTRVTLHQLISVAMYAVCTAPAEHREPLRQRLLQEVADGRGYCIPGRFARILNAFAGFEEVVLGIKPVDPRSLAERLGDAFAALNRTEQTDEAKRAAAERILTENGVVEAAERQPWLEAL